MNLRPLNDFVLVKMDPLPDRTSAGGIHLTYDNPVRTGTVIRSGPGRLFVGEDYRPSESKPGDRIAFFTVINQTRQGKSVVHLLGDDQTIIRESDILFFIEEGNPRIEQ